MTAVLWVVAAHLTVWAAMAVLAWRHYRASAPADEPPSVAGLYPPPDDEEPQYSQRGFKRFVLSVPSAYGGEVAVYESSAASHPHVWLMVTCPSNLNDPGGSSIEAVAHLRLDDATRLRDQLTYLIEHHYQQP